MLVSAVLVYAAEKNAAFSSETALSLEQFLVLDVFLLFNSLERDEHFAHSILSRHEVVSLDHCCRGLILGQPFPST